MYTVYTLIRKSQLVEFHGLRNGIKYDIMQKNGGAYQNGIQKSDIGRPESKLG